MAEIKSSKKKRVTMVVSLCGPEGNARAGDVLTVPEVVAQEWIDGRFAREFDKDRDGMAVKLGRTCLRTPRGSD